jgi:hypothetical protein
MRVPPTPPPLDLDRPADIEREQRRRHAGMLDGVTDSHVHLFPLGFYEALWRWFDKHAWDIAFRGTAEQSLHHLRGLGTGPVVASVFAHKAGVARLLNKFLGDLVRAETGVTGLGTVLPGEPDAADIVREAIEVHGLRGIKLHCHVMKAAVDDPATMAVLAQCQESGVPAVVHAGREPASDAYGIDCHALCNASRTERVLRQLPRLKLVVPHVGADEFDRYFALLGQHEHLYLDTAMACADYFDHRPGWDAIVQWSHRVLYGTDFPIVPYEADRELRVLARRIDDDGAFRRITRETARGVFGV